jgi:hypothetical protein
MRDYRNNKPEWPISFDEFIERKGQCKRGGNIIGVVWIIVFISVLCLNLVILHLIKNTIILIVFQTLVFSFLILSAILPFKILKRRLKSHGLQCFKCNALLDDCAIETVVRTGRCGSCGSQLIKDHTYETKPITSDIVLYEFGGIKFEVNLEEFKKFRFRECSIFILFFAGFFGFPMGFLWILSHIDPSKLPFAARLGIGCFFVCFIFVYLFLWYKVTFRHRRKKSAL